MPDIEWEVETLLLTVTSPNWEKNDERRPWKAKDQQGRERFFRVEDNQFWHLVHSGKLDTGVLDTILVQWARAKRRRRNNGRVLRVIKYNNTTLGAPLDDNALSTLLGSYRKPSGTDLFTLSLPGPSSGLLGSQ